MGEHFVTLFDSNFLIQGLALHSSLTRECGDFTLWILCLDEEVLSRLEVINLPNVNCLYLPALETTELLEVRANRSKAEYCWTLTPWSIKWVFDADPGISRVTYIDADMYFFADPYQIFSSFEKSGKSVLITDHGYAPENDQSKYSGKFCVQFVTFTSGDGQLVLDWWRDRCMEWCYDKIENNLFGDQRYLESFEQILPGGIYCIDDADPSFQAPWNSQKFCYSRSVAYHFHGLRHMGNKLCFLTDYTIPQVVLANIYSPYLARVESLSTKYSITLPLQKTKPSLWGLFNLWLRKKLAYKLFRIQFAPFYASKRRTHFFVW